MSTPVQIPLSLIRAALAADPAAAVMAGWGSRQVEKAGSLCALAQQRIRNVGDVRIRCDDALDALVAGLDPESPVEVVDDERAA